MDYKTKYEALKGAVNQVGVATLMDFVKGLDEAPSKEEQPTKAELLSMDYHELAKWKKENAEAYKLVMGGK